MPPSPPEFDMPTWDVGDCAYSHRDKGEFYGIVLSLPHVSRRDCPCKGENHDPYCADTEGCRPVSIEEARKAVAHLHPVWQEILSVLEKEPDAFIVWR